MLAAAATLLACAFAPSADLLHSAASVGLLKPETARALSPAVLNLPQALAVSKPLVSASLAIAPYGGAVGGSALATILPTPARVALVAVASPFVVASLFPGLVNILQSVLRTVAMGIFGVAAALERWRAETLSELKGVPHVEVLPAPPTQRAESPVMTTHADDPAKIRAIMLKSLTKSGLVAAARKERTQKQLEELKRRREA